jgi:hypothetical protein
MNFRFAVPAADTKHWGSALAMRFAQFVSGRMTARTTKMPTKFVVGQMALSALLKGAQIFANSEHLNVKIYLMCESPITMSRKSPNNAVKAAPFGRWTLRDKAPRRAPYLQRWAARP